MPLQFDMPFAELAHYQGVTPRPSDFDLFWNEAIAEMQTVDPQMELVPLIFKPLLPNVFIFILPGWAGRASMPNCCVPNKGPNRIRRC